MTRSKPDTSNDAVLYLRVSTQEQAREGISLAAQEAKLRAYCDLRGLQIVEVVTDAGVSGGKPMYSRAGGQRILDLVKRGAVTHVIAYKLDRLVSGLCRLPHSHGGMGQESDRATPGRPGWTDA